MQISVIRLGVNPQRPQWLACLRNSAQALCRAMCNTILPERTDQSKVCSTASRHPRRQ